MRLRLLCLMIFATLAIPSFSQALEGLYAGVLGGVNFLQKDHHSGTRYKTGYAVGAVAGLKTCESIRFEAEFMYRNNQRHSGNGRHRQSYSFMGNAYYDFDLCSCFVPYLGVGLGADWDRHHNSGGDRRHRTRFAVQGIAGVSYPITCNIDISADYRYHWASRHGHNDHVKQDHTITAGVKYYF